MHTCMNMLVMTERLLSKWVIGCSPATVKPQVGWSEHDACLRKDDYLDRAGVGNSGRPEEAGEDERGQADKPAKKPAAQDSMSMQAKACRRRKRGRQVKPAACALAATSFCMSPSLSGPSSCAREVRHSMMPSASPRMSSTLRMPASFSMRAMRRMLSPWSHSTMKRRRYWASSAVWMYAADTKSTRCVQAKFLMSLKVGWARAGEGMVQPGKMTCREGCTVVWCHP